MFFTEKFPSIRLQGPLSSSGTGRVEVFHNGEWGTICDWRWDLNDAKVACRQLGYPYAISALSGIRVPDGFGRIWLSRVECTGSEQNLTNCYHYGWGYTFFCDHSRDAGVKCSMTGKIMLCFMHALECFTDDSL